MFNVKPKLFRWSEVTLDFQEPSTVQIYHKETKETFFSAHRNRSLRWNLKRAVRTLDIYIADLQEQSDKDGKA